MIVRIKFTKITATEDDGSQKGIQYICIHIAIYI